MLGVAPDKRPLASFCAGRHVSLKKHAARVARAKEIRDMYVDVPIK